MTIFIPLSKREKEVVKLVLQGKSNKMIALALGISNRTVEFHLKNVYVKFQVSSRVELILKLGNATGIGQIENLGQSTVAHKGKNAENRDHPISMIGKELTMKKFFTTKHALVGAITAFFAGLTWVVLMRYFVHMSVDDIQAWILPTSMVWIWIGLLVGWIGYRAGNTPLKVSFSVFVGTGFSPVTILPLMGFVVLPIAKFAEWLGLINSAAIPRNVATTLAIIIMLGIWFVVGTVIGSLLLYVTVKGPAPKISPMPTLEHGR